MQRKLIDALNKTTVKEKTFTARTKGLRNATYTWSDDDHYFYGLSQQEQRD